MIEPYIHKIQYYETDKMGITHHSNYVRFMKEARIDFLERIGYGFARLEQEGLASPVISVSLKFHRTTTFSDELHIYVRVIGLTATRLHVGYTMECDHAVVCVAESEHCFVDSHSRPVSLKRVNPTLFETLASYAEA